MFGEVRKNFGFGCMRLPMKDNDVDYAEFSKMIDAFLDAGFNYFDTAHGYLHGKSETALRDCLVARYPRDKYVLTDKLTDSYFKCEEDIRPLFEKQLAACGVDYFDFYLMHTQTKKRYEYFKCCSAYEQALEFKKEGKIKHFGISFHDTAEVLEQILTEYPQIDVVQIQLNYLDYEDTAVQSRKCLEVCNKYGKPVIVMEPVKGGNLVNLPEQAQKIIDKLGQASPASYAIRFAASCKGVFMTLSGMSNFEQMQDNLSYMKDFVPLTDVEKQTLSGVCDIIKTMNMIPCTACRYCVDGCPKKIAIPDLFAFMNTKNLYRGFNANHHYIRDRAIAGGKASDCIKCGKCEAACPQHLKIRELLQTVAKELDNY